MFKFGSSEIEIMESMEKSLVTKDVDQKSAQIVRAAEYLTAAADIFDSAGMNSEADEITEILNTLVK